MSGDGRGEGGSGALVLSVSRPRPGTVVVHVAGAIDLATAPAVRDAVVGHLDGAQLVLDLGSVDFFSGSAAQLLLDLRAEAAERGSVLHLTEPADRHVRHVLDLIGIGAGAPLHATVEDALQHVDAPNTDRPGPADVDPASGSPAIQRAAALAGEVARLAGEIGETEDVIAAQRERMARERPHRAAQLEEHARRARRFAEHERGEEERWQRVHDAHPSEAHPSDDDPDAGR